MSGMKGLTGKNYKDQFLDKVKLENIIRIVFTSLPSDNDFKPFWSMFDTFTEDYNYQTFLSDVLDSDVLAMIQKHIANLYNAYTMLNSIQNEDLGTAHEQVSVNAYVSTSTGFKPASERKAGVEDDNNRKRLAQYQTISAEFDKMMEDVNELLDIHISGNGAYGRK